VPVIEDFARLYMRRVADGPLLALGADELAAHVISIYHFAYDRGLNPVSVRVFNPTPDDHGYTAKGTVVEISTEDRPFLIDSVTGEIQDHNVTVDHVTHPVIGTIRDDDGGILEVTPARHADVRESVQHYQLGRVLSSPEREKLHEGIVSTLGDVRKVVEDFEPLKASILRMIDLVRAGSSRYSDTKIASAEAFLQWLLDLNFVFLGYREYEITEVDGAPSLGVVKGSGLGILRGKKRSAYRTPVPLADLPDELRKRYESGDCWSSPRRTARRRCTDE